MQQTAGAMHKPEAPPAADAQCSPDEVRGGRGHTMTRGVISTIVLGIFALCGSADASKRVPLPTMRDLATVWVGGGRGDLEFLRLELRENGTGVLTVQYLPARPAVAYRVTATALSKYRVDFTLAPAETGAEAVYLSGEAIPGELALEFGGITLKWKRSIQLVPLSVLMERIRVVTERAATIEGVAQWAGEQAHAPDGRRAAHVVFRAARR
jgi:hypothetical protein